MGYLQGKFVPAGLSDDLGIYLFIPALSSKLHVSVAHAVDLFFGCVIALGFGAGSVGLFVSVQSNAGRALGTTVLLCLLLMTLVKGDVYAVQSSFAVAIIPWTGYFAESGRLGRWRLPLGFAFGLTTYLVNAVRMQAGTAVLLFVAVVAFGARGRMSRKWSLALAVLIGFSAAMWIFGVAVHHRDEYLSHQDSLYQSAVAHHATWHTIYAGLGFLQNDYGMKYDDTVPFTKVQSIDPRAEYLSPQYERILEQSVVSFVKIHPRFVLDTLVAKTGVLLFALLVFANIGLIAAIRYPKPWSVDLAYGVSLVFTALPALLAVPRIAYMLGHIAFAGLYGIASFEYAFLQRKEASVARHQLTPEFLSASASASHQGA